MKKTKLGQEIIKGLNEAIAYTAAEKGLRSHRALLADPPSTWSPKSITGLRVNHLKVSQPIFASYLGVTSAAVKSWEQGDKKPSGTARRLMDLLVVMPDQILRSLK